MVIIPHRHCVICGKAVELDKHFCSKDCEETFKKERRRQRNFTLFMFLLLFILLALLFIFAPR
ncbi:MAG: DUF2116 family Zn-ribbon domain-containing protein [Archaeoglobaceae archaeon]|nr:DUF2116 family Zn-ribbon domain-containing protein [Archaeoglobaceae archaeon]MCX8151916.1 DUF2116 family Zn-ribbon domain-containing protein [Archaeoglobaceae archaeon]MDW8013305.1 DUF2116 family Zn-ribbon domain-containing protein [Archaeoglobaceae archaeon]